MKVDFNNLRLAACKDLDKLIKFLNNHVDEGEVRFEMDDIVDYIHNLQNSITFIACTFEEGNENFSNIRDKVNISDLDYDEDYT